MPKAFSASLNPLHPDAVNLAAVFLPANLLSSRYSFSSSSILILFSSSLFVGEFARGHWQVGHAGDAVRSWDGRLPVDRGSGSCRRRRSRSRADQVVSRRSHRDSLIRVGTTVVPSVEIVVIVDNGPNVVVIVFVVVSRLIAPTRSP